jgi:hypothetical protein
MTQYSQGQLETLWLNTAKGTKYETQGWAFLMSAIAMAESGGRSDAHNPSGATGLWQILGAVNASDQPRLYDPATNAHEALLKLQSQGLGAWETYTNGAYRSFLGSVSPGSLPTGSGSGDTSAASTATGTQTTGFDWNLNPIPGLGQLGKVITGSTGTFSSIGDAAKAIAGLAQVFSKLTQLFMMLFRPEFWLRVGAFLFGLLTLGAAVYFLHDAL